MARDQPVAHDPADAGLLAWSLIHNLGQQLGAEPAEASALAPAVARGRLAQPIRLRPGGCTSPLAAPHQMQQSLQQTVSTARPNAEHAHTARQRPDSAAAVAQQGGQAMQAVVQTMKGIEDSSRRIGDSVGRVDAGTPLVGRAADRMGEIVAAIGRAKELVGEISATNEEQGAGVAQSGEAVAQMDQVTQQNAAMVEENLAAAESLRARAAHLLGAVSRFDLGASSTRAAP